MMVADVVLHVSMDELSLDASFTALVLPIPNTCCSFAGMDSVLLYLI
jgi:hypothetical protein